MKLLKVLSEGAETFAGILGCEHCDWTEEVQDLPKAQDWRQNTLPTKHCPSCQRSRSGQVNPEITAPLEQQKQAKTDTPPVEPVAPVAPPEETPPDADHPLGEGSAEESDPESDWP